MKDDDYKYSNEYIIWRGIIRRCSSSKDKQAHRYIDRGITISDEWRDFHTFLSDLGPRPSKKHSVDRIDPNGNYCKENCRWETASIQNMNKPLKSGRASKYRGVRPLKKRWGAYIAFNYVDYALGIFDTEIEAALAYNKKALEFYGEKAVLNII
jgi:hypothetical protein